MMATAPAPEILADHRGRPRAVRDMPLTYQQARLGMAFHEAGHAVLAMAYGMTVHSSEVTAWEPAEGRWAVTGNTKWQGNNTPPWHFAAMCAGGQVAHVDYLMTYGLWTPERALACDADHDREQAIDILTAHGMRISADGVPEGGKSWAMVRGMARRKVAHLWREIRTVAHAMDEDTKLTGNDIAALTGLAHALTVREVAA
ncbi:MULTISPECIES: hypothetical protein [unclassified Streptomyces]|uniref:hypothetical protein n=1 Tax=unclassified Streptomyces TaxID=2593676 RepID=UPI000DBA1459|nr:MULTISPECIES: hypothetical protein [unclassified Streptomyces]MYT70721.1 hypothetical protein [Streptomyces sp. SID8367]RAJ90426.1 hypothetical protein K377_01051 [Streptomyces sp. PsTaAH-137]